MTASDKPRGRSLCAALTTEYLDTSFGGAVTAEMGTGGATPTLCERRREEAVFVNLCAKGETMGLSEMGVGGRDRLRSSGLRMYDAYIAVFKLIESVELRESLFWVEAAVTVLMERVGRGVELRVLALMWLWLLGCVVVDVLCI